MMDRPHKNASMRELILGLKERGVLHSREIEQALLEVDRAQFVPEESRSLAYKDVALPIAEGQTISQPYTVVFMLEHLHVRPGDIVLDVGFGSCWQTALLAHLVGSTGRVYAFEFVPNLCQIGKSNLDNYTNLSKRVQLLCMSAEQGYAEVAPFDRIVSAAAVEAVPPMWREQLIPGGRMVYPKGNSLILEIKGADGSLVRTEFPGFVFVPFVAA